MYENKVDSDTNEFLRTGLGMKNEWHVVTEFENKIAEFFGAPYAVATDCCTNALELCLRLEKQKQCKEVRSIKVPFNTYISVPNMLIKNGWRFQWGDIRWHEYYYLTKETIDAAVYWKRNGYEPGTRMCLSFFYRKHLSTDRGGMILLDNKEDAELLRIMCYDGRQRSNVCWNQQRIDTFGYHYYMTPHKAKLGLRNFEKVKDKKPIRRDWDWYPDIHKLPVFESMGDKNFDVSTK